MKKKFLFVALLTLFLAFSINAHTPKNGLGDAAVSPDGKILAAGGDSRVLYIMDPSSLEVKKRVWLKTGIYEMEFNKDGSILVVEDTSEDLYFVKTTDWQVLKTIRKGGPMSAAPAADLLAGFTSGYKKSTAAFYSMTDGALKGKVECPAKIVSVGLNAKGTRMVLMAEGPKDMETKKQRPKELKGIEKDIFTQKNDGKVSILAEYEVPSGKKISEKTIFYSTSSPLILVGEKKTYIIGYSNVNAVIEGDNITLFNGKSSYNYGMGISPDRKAFLLGGLRDGTLVHVDGLAMTTFKIDSLPGWPEYYKGFGFGPDGTGYAVTTSFRLVKIDKTGKIEKTVPVY